MALENLRVGFTGGMKICDTRSVHAVSEVARQNQDKDIWVTDAYGNKVRFRPDGTWTYYQAVNQPSAKMAELLKHLPSERKTA